MSNLRVQAPELGGPVPLQSPGVPGDTFTGAPQPVQDNNLARISDALSALNPALAKWGTAAAAAQKKQQHDIDVAAANKEIAGHTREEYLARVEGGAIPNYADPFARGMVEKSAGQDYGDRAVAGIQTDIRTGKIDLLDPNTNIAQVVTDAANTQIAAMPPAYQTSPHTMAGMRQRIEAARDTLVRQQMEARSSDFTQKQEGVALSQINRVFDSAAKSPPDVIQSKIRGIYLDIGNGKFLKNEQLDQLLLDSIKNHVTDPDRVVTALHVLSADRTGKDGAAVPSLIKNPKYVAQVQAIQSIARNTLSTKYDDDAKDRATWVATGALERQDGSWWNITNSTYQNPYAKGDTDRTISAAEIKKAAVDRVLMRSAQEAVARHETAETNFEREWQIFQNSDVAQPQWKATLEGAARALTNPQALSDPAKRREAQVAGELYLTMSERNHPYVKTTLGLDKNALDFYTVYDVARSQMGLNGDRALDMAASSIRTSDNENDLAVRQQKARDVAAKVASINWGSSWYNSIPFFSEAAENQGMIQKRVMDVASVLTRVSGMKVDDAVTNAAELVRQRSFFVNGHVVPDRGYLPPRDMQPLIEKALGVSFGLQY